MDELFIIRDKDEATTPGELYLGARKEDNDWWHVAYFFLRDDRWIEDHTGPAVGVNVSTKDIDRLYELAHADDPPTVPQPTAAEYRTQQEWPGIVCPP